MSFKCEFFRTNNGTYQDTYAWILYQNLEYSEAKKWILKALKWRRKECYNSRTLRNILYKLGETIERLRIRKKQKNWVKGQFI